MASSSRKSSRAPDPDHLCLRPRHVVGSGHIYLPKLPSAAVFTPTEEEFANFPSYVARIAEEAKTFGICKVVPPASWQGPTSAPPSDSFTLKSAIRQHTTGTQGVFTMVHQEKDTKTSYHAFAKQAATYAARENVAPGASLDALEEKFWNEVTTASAPLYGADIDGSFFTHDVTAWNLNTLPDLLRTGPARLKQRMSGINTPMLYFGGFRTTFCMHVEDMDLVSASMQAFT